MTNRELPCGTRPLTLRLVLGSSLLLVAIGGCSPAPAAEWVEPESTVFAPAHASATAVGEPLWSKGDAWSVAALPRLVIGQDDTQPEYQFRSVRSGTLLEDGAVLVVDAGLAAVRLYRADGTFGMAYGRRGRGPGEFETPVNVIQGPAGSIHVWDGSLWRRTHFSADGEVEGTDRYDPAKDGLYPADGLYPETLVQSSDGWLALMLSSKGGAKGAVAGKDGSKPPAATSLRPRAALALHRFGEPVLQFIVPAEGPAEIEVDMPWGPTLVRPVLSPTTVFAVDPRGGRICMGDQAAPVIACHDAEGGVVAVRLPGEREVLRTDSPEVERWLEETTEVFSAKLERTEAERGLARVPVPSFYPWFGEMQIDRRGNLWVSAPRSGEDGRMWRVFDSRLVLLGEVTLPEMTVLEITDSAILGVATNELGVQTVVVYDLDRLPG